MAFSLRAAQSPKDIPDSGAQGSATASYVCSLLSKERVKGESYVSVVNEDLYIGCVTCISVCPYGAREFSERGTDGSSNKCEAFQGRPDTGTGGGYSFSVMIRGGEKDGGDKKKEEDGFEPGIGGVLLQLVLIRSSGPRRHLKIEVSAERAYNTSVMYVESGPAVYY